MGDLNIVCRITQCYRFICLKHVENINHSFEVFYSYMGTSYLPPKPNHNKFALFHKLCTSFCPTINKKQNKNNLFATSAPVNMKPFLLRHFLSLNFLQSHLFLYQLFYLKSARTFDTNIQYQTTIQFTYCLFHYLL